MAMESTKAIEEGRKPEAGDMTERDGGRGGWRGRPPVRLRVTVSAGVMPGFCGGGAVSVGQVLSLLETSQHWGQGKRGGGKQTVYQEIPKSD